MDSPIQLKPVKPRATVKRHPCTNDLFWIVRDHRGWKYGSTIIIAYKEWFKRYAHRNQST